MGLFNRSKSQTVPSSPAPAPTAPKAVDWSNIESVKAEWPQASLDPQGDRGASVPDLGPRVIKVVVQGLHRTHLCII